MSRPDNDVLVVDRELAGCRLFDLLARANPGVHRADLRQLVAAGGVSINGEACVSDRRMRAGDVVLVPARQAPRTYRQSGPAEELTVLFESDGAVVVAKPAGVPSVPDRSGKQPGVHGRLTELRPDDDLRIVHRLDRDTSGCLLLAKGLDAARHFDVQFRDRQVHKLYVALVDGVPRFDECTIDAWLGPDRRRPGSVVAADEPRRGFREAHTAVAVRTRFRRHALLELSPKTGRGHQLRVHLQSIGHPIVADETYGGQQLLLSRIKSGYKQRPGVAERPLLQRMFLHAEQLAFADIDGGDVAVSAPLPDDLAVALRHVGKHSGANGQDAGPTGSEPPHSTRRNQQCD